MPGGQKEESQPDRTEKLAENTEGEAAASGQNPADEALQRAEEVAEQGASVAEDAPDNGVVTFEVKQGDSSVSVARRAEEMGLVESAVEFDRFLCQNGYDRRISPGSYQISAMASQKEIADKITRS